MPESRSKISESVAVIWVQSLLFIISVCTFSSQCNTLAQIEEREDDNLAVFRNLAQEVAEETLSRCDLAGEDVLTISAIPPVHEANWVLENALVEAVTSRGMTAQTPGPSDMGITRDPAHGVNTTHLFYRIIRAGVSYDRLSRGLFRKDRLERLVFIDAYLKVVATNGTILYSGDSKREWRDVMHMSEKSKLENPSFSFTSSEAPSARGLKRYVEPVLIVGVTGAIVYLFYAYRGE